MPRKSKYPVITKKNWLPVQQVKGITNYVSSKKMISDKRKARDEAGITAEMLHYCWFCGRPFKRHQAFVAHLKFCEERKKFKIAMTKGFLFQIGSRDFVVHTNRWGWLREAEKVEQSFNAQIANGAASEAKVQELFNWYIAGHQDSFPRITVDIDTSTNHDEEELIP